MTSDGMTPENITSVPALFTFGTLMDDDVLQQVSGQSLATLSRESAVVRDHVRRYVLGDFYPVLVPSPGSQTIGLIIRGLEAEPMERIAFFEGEEFSLRSIQVERENGTVEQVRYFADNLRKPAGEQAWSLEQWQRDCKTDTMPMIERYMQCYGVMSIAEADAYW